MTWLIESVTKDKETHTCKIIKLFIEQKDKIKITKANKQAAPWPMALLKASGLSREYCQGRKAGVGQVKNQPVTHGSTAAYRARRCWALQILAVVLLVPLKKKRQSTRDILSN